jgi:hypothetical protein
LHELQVPVGSAYRTAVALLAAGNPSAANFRPAWQERQVRITVRDDDHIDLEFAKRHPRTEALAAAVLEDAVGPASSLAEQRELRDPVVAAADSGSSLIRPISQPSRMRCAACGNVERPFADDAVVVALRFGEVDVVDRIAPGILVITETREVRPTRFRCRSTAPHPFRPSVVAKQEFRRARLCPRSKQFCETTASPT